MTATATRDRALPAPSAALDGSVERLFEPGGTTLEEIVVELWDRLVVEGQTVCPVCGGSMSAAGGCESCGAELS